MTRATRQVKVGTGADAAVVFRPTVRMVEGHHGPMVVELEDRALRLRPRRTKAGGPAEVVVSWEHVYSRFYRPVTRARKRGAR